MYSDECCDLLKKRIIALTKLIRFKTDAFIDYCQMTYAPDEFIEVLENL